MSAVLIPFSFDCEKSCGSNSVPWNQVSWTIGDLVSLGFSWHILPPFDELNRTIGTMAAECLPRSRDLDPVKVLITQRRLVRTQARSQRVCNSFLNLFSIYSSSSFPYGSQTWTSNSPNNKVRKLGLKTRIRQLSTGSQPHTNAFTSLS